MIEVQQDLWTVEADVRCITTNGTVTSRGTNIMGGGCAAEAARRYPKLPAQYGDLILSHGHHVYLIYPLVMFPTKDDVREPSTVERVRKSLHELLTLADVYAWRAVALPRPGCGLGGLDWETDVLPLVAPLDDRFILVDFPRA